jgi:hypothetical protein
MHVCHVIVCECVYVVVSLYGNFNVYACLIYVFLIYVYI